MTKKYIMYLRKSSKSDERQVLSIAGQEREVTDVAERNGVSIVGEPLREAMTAKEPGRPLFNQMMEDLKSGKANGIICWKADRLARNPVDAASLLWGLKKGYISEIVTCGRTFTASSDDKFMLQIDFGIANKYIDDLSINVKRGNKDALEAGQWPNRPKLGYIRDRDSNAIVPDPERFSLIKEMWRLRLDGVPVLEILRRCRDEWGLVTPRYRSVGGKPLSSSQIYKLFREPFYAGVMRYNDELYPGTHKCMISWTEFETVQNMFQISHLTPKPKQQRFVYRGLITCGRCGSLVTAERTTNRYGKEYIYYHCCKKNKNYFYCPEGSVQEQYIDSIVEAALEEVAVPTTVVSWVNERLDSLKAEARSAKEQSKSKLKQELAHIEGKLTRARNLCIDDVLSADEYKKERTRLIKNQQRVLDQLAKAEQDPELLEPFRSQISFVNQAKKVFRSSDEVNRKKIVQMIFSNLTLKGKNLLYVAKEPYKSLKKISSIPSLCRHWPDVRTKLLAGEFKVSDIDSQTNN